MKLSIEQISFVASITCIKWELEINHHWQKSLESVFDVAAATISIIIVLDFKQYFVSNTIQTSCVCMFAVRRFLKVVKCHNFETERF